MLVTDPFFNFVEVHAQSITQITDNTFEYIHKVNDLYYYMGEIQRLISSIKVSTSFLSISSHLPIR